MGAVAGPLIAVVALLAGASLRTVLWIAVLPGAVTLLLIRLVREAPRPGAGHPDAGASWLTMGSVPESGSSFTGTIWNPSKVAKYMSLGEMPSW